LGNYLAKSGIKVYGICATENAKHFHQEINTILKDLGVNKRSEEIITIIDDTVGLGYALNTPQELQSLVDIARKTGVILDPTYTLKSVLGFLSSPQFKNRRVLFVHTGGIFGLFTGKDWSKVTFSNSITTLEVPAKL